MLKCSLSFCCFCGFWSFSSGFRPAFLLSGLILESVFLWLCFFGQKPPCTLRGAYRSVILRPGPSGKPSRTRAGRWKASALWLAPLGMAPGVAVQCTLRRPGWSRLIDGGKLLAVSQRDPEVNFGPSDFLEAWGAKAKKPHIFRKHVIFRPWYRRPPKTHLAKQTTSGSL